MRHEVAEHEERPGIAELVLWYNLWMGACCCCAQALCFLAGANSIFDGDTLLTTPNNERNEDLKMFDQLGLTSRPAFLPYAAGAASTHDGAAVEAGEQRVALAGQ